MIRRRLLSLLGLASTLLLCSSPARAQGIRIFAMGSGSFFLNQKFFTAVGEPFRSDYASGGKITFGGELTPSKMLGIEAAYGYGTNNLRLTNLGESPSTTQGYGVHTQRFSSNLVVHSPVSLLGVRPYLTAGAEYDRLGPTGQAKSTAFTQGFADQRVTLGASNKMGFNYGGGVEWGFFPALALRLDFRDHVTGTPTYGLSSATYHVSGTGHDAELSAGLVLHLGR